jgi:hypothetical protein
VLSCDCVHVVKLIEGWLAHHAWHNTSLVVDPRVPVVLLTCLGTTRHEKMAIGPCLGRHLDTMAQHDTKGPARLEY